MVQFKFVGAELFLPRNLALLDTNVLVAFADPGDKDHEQVELFFEVDDTYAFLVAPPVIVEACGVLARRRTNRIALQLLNWLWTPGNVILLPSPHPPKEIGKVLAEHTAWMSKYEVDYVDSYLIEVAHRLTVACELRPFVPIVTFDTGDYLKCSRRGHFFSVYDMKDLQLLEFTA
jgi:predicted nucleic acid-binding protein